MDSRYKRIEKSKNYTVLKNCFQNNIDLLLYNSADNNFDPKSNINAVVYSNGEVGKK